MYERDFIAPGAKLQRDEVHRKEMARSKSVETLRLVIIGHLEQNLIQLTEICFSKTR